MSDLLPLLRASVDLIRQTRRIRQLERENALLRAQINVTQLKLQQRLESTSQLPALLRPQAG
jgi:hypothetical protein